MEGIRTEQAALHEEATSDFPLDKSGSQALLDDLHDRLVVIVEAEKEATQILKTALT
jgi:hypothetical protein